MNIYTEQGLTFRFQQDNASPQRGLELQTNVSKRGISTLEWHALSPDLNPVENLWGEIVRNVYGGEKLLKQ
jgi:transposase